MATYCNYFICSFCNNFNNNFVFVRTKTRRNNKSIYFNKWLDFIPNVFTTTSLLWCTLVKPIRYGIRRNQKIVVNRQLCIANAFEQLIEEKTPRFHKAIRYIYDKYGYPLSKHINTPLQADVTYIFMKPLEYIFLIILYLFDKEPENRIAKQYLPKIEE